MKTFVLFLFCSISFLGHAQGDVDKIKDAIANADAAVISSYFSDEVDLTVLDDEDIYNKSQASQKIKSFFNGVSGKNFNIKHQGTSKLNHQYYIGDFTTTSNDKYRVTFFVKSVNGQSKISQFRIEEF